MSATASMFAQSFFHGTKTDLKSGDLIVTGCQSNFLEGKPLSWVYFTGTLDAAIWGTELSAGSGRERMYRGADRADRGRPQPDGQEVSRQPDAVLSLPRAAARYCRSDDVAQGHPPERLQQKKDGLARLKAEGAEIID